MSVAAQDGRWLALGRELPFAGCPKIYGQLVQMLTPFSRVIKDAKDGSEPVPELAEVTPETVLAASLIESAEVPAPVKRTAVRLKKADSLPS